MLTNIRLLTDQLRTLRKCGISTVFAPDVLADEAARRQWCVKAVALLHGHDIDDFAKDLWVRVLSVVATDGMTISGVDGFTRDEREQLTPLLRAAEELFEVVRSQSAELAGRTISI